MSIYVERATIMLHRMINTMYQKDIELARITKCATQFLMTGISSNSISGQILDSCIKMQNPDGGWVSVVDTIWNAKFLSFFPDTNNLILNAISYLDENRVSKGFGRSKRDIPRIPVSVSKGCSRILKPEACRSCVNKAHLPFPQEMPSAQRLSACT